MADKIAEALQLLSSKLNEVNAKTDDRLTVSEVQTLIDSDNVMDAENIEVGDLATLFTSL